ncbi:hypothetical protein PFICI_13170 [Pestalotiopsis fici W106-1]|uniref:beta-glucosidase n=1 Tax=Pestalotiopsis fici (strain W106-1 / CGMCC3.15140) TaxID=1229662 RepID=W3WPE5_PESFW|nr:uncharacterized protein PFICI_13170 [Pestalotiopsis fici W106-1]ETS74686.1 hypothetical protein PFICI_13170 [Pestalotiopsis fici W106-1]
MGRWSNSWRVPKGVETPPGSDFDVEAILKLGIPSIRRSDGPNGIRGTRFFGSVSSACLPCGMAIGATFDQELAREIGHLLADEARAKGAHVILGPTVNIPRAPLGGRGFESYSEDPVLSGLMAGALTREPAARSELSGERHDGRDSFCRACQEPQTYEILVQWGCAKTSKLKVPATVDFGHGGFRISGCRRLDLAQGIADAVELAKNSDQVILFAGLSGEWESEGEDRETLDLPPCTDDLIDRVLEANRNTVIVIQSGTPVLLPWIHKAKDVLHAWYGGNETGNGIADDVFQTSRGSLCESQLSIRGWQVFVWRGCIFSYEKKETLS